MIYRARFKLLACLLAFGLFAAGGPFEHSAQAQNFGRGQGSGGGRLFGRGNGGGRDNRGGRQGGEQGRRGDGPNNSNSSGGGSNNGSPGPSSSPSAPSSDSKSSGSISTGLDMKSYAAKLVDKHDKNGDHMLQPEEQKELSRPASEADLDKDGVITIDELVMQLTSKSPPAASSLAGGGTSSSSGNGSKGGADGLAGRVYFGSAGGSTAKSDEQRRTYRFSTSGERSSSRLPDSLKVKDANGDGQIEMSEFSRAWSKNTVADFRRYDLNDDGIITAKEAGK